MFVLSQTIHQRVMDRHHPLEVSRFHVVLVTTWSRISMPEINLNFTSPVNRQTAHPTHLQVHRVQVKHAKMPAIPNIKVA